MGPTQFSPGTSPGDPLRHNRDLEAIPPPPHETEQGPQADHSEYSTFGLTQAS